jgi:arylformamidase
MRYIELSHEIADGMPVFPGLPAPRVTVIRDHEQSRSAYANQAEFFFGGVDMPGNTGTYLDSPFHRHRDRRDIAALRLDEVAGLPGVVVAARVGDDRAISIDAAEDELTGRAVLVRTGWDERWGTAAYWEPGPYLSAAALDVLLRARPRLVGVDCWNADDVEDPSRRVHTELLSRDVLIVEHLCNLGALPRVGFRFFAVPLRIVGGGSFPVRAFAELDED